MKPKNIEKDSVLFVEGSDECNFFDGILKNIGVDNVQCIDVGGIKQFNNKFITYSKASGFCNIAKIAFIRDAEKMEAVNALNSIKSTVHRSKIHFSIEEISLSRNIIKNNGVVCGVYIMPDNNSSGMLEDLFIEYFQNEPISACVYKYMECLEDKGIILQNKSKSTVLSYLASKDECNRIGLAAKQNYIDYSKKCFNPIKDFLKKMYLS